MAARSAMFSQIFESPRLHLITGQGVIGVDLDVVSQVRLETQLILQLGKEWLSFPLGFWEDLDLQGNVIQVSLFDDDHFELIGQPRNGTDHFFDGRGRQQNPFDFSDVVRPPGDSSLDHTERSSTGTGIL